MKDNPLFAEGKSRRRKIIDEFEINLGRCILCGICVDVCNFDAIEMGHEHELSKYERNGSRVDLPQLLEMGKEYQAEVGWNPKQPEKNSGVPLEKDSAPDGEAARTSATAAPAKELSKEERLAAARARAQAKGGAGPTAADEATTPATTPTTATMTKEERLEAARARARAKREDAKQADSPQETDAPSVADDDSG